MFKVEATEKNEWNRNEIIKREYEFETAGELTHYLDYNRAYIVRLTINGSIETEN